jgi:AraC-like DNA-binding protein
MQTKTERHCTCCPNAQISQPDEQRCASCNRIVRPSREDKFTRGLCHTCYSRAWSHDELDKYPRRRTPENHVIEEQVERYLKLVSPGWGFTPKEACRELEIPYNTMATRIRNRGMRMDGSLLTEEKIKYRGKPDRLAEDYWTIRANGNDLTMTQIASRLGVSDRTLYRALAETSYEW